VDVPFLNWILVRDSLSSCIADRTLTLSNGGELTGGRAVQAFKVKYVK
jgi:hypothetical protein